VRGREYKPNAKGKREIIEGEGRRGKGIGPRKVGRIRPLKCGCPRQALLTGHVPAMKHTEQSATEGDSKLHTCNGGPVPWKGVNWASALWKGI